MDSRVLVVTSQVRDGSMSAGVSDEERSNNRQTFLQANNIEAEQAVLVHLQYSGDDYRRYFTVSSDMAGDGIRTPSTIIADALFVREKHLALVLPIADCIGAVLYDPKNQVLGLAHLGRHNLSQRGGTSVIEYMVTDFGTSPASVHVYLSCAAGRENYPLYDFDNRSLTEVALEQLLAAGVYADNVFSDERDTTKDMSLFSHSEFLKGNRAIDGRQAIVCMMRT